MISIPHLGLTENEIAGAGRTNQAPVLAAAEGPAKKGLSQPVNSCGVGLPVRPQASVVIQPHSADRSSVSLSPSSPAGPREGKTPNLTPAEGAASRATEVNPAQQQNKFAIHRLRDAILDRFPLASPAIVLFVGSENNIHTDFASARIAASLANLAVGKILLVDSCPTKRLSRAYRAVDNCGVSNLLATTDDWQSSIVSFPIGELDFLPAGTSHWEHWGAEARLIQMAAEWKRNYQFILVTAGDAHQPMAKLWTSVCDGSYLMVSMKNSNPEIAESAVTELQVSGARLLGCIATDYSHNDSFK